MDHLQMIGQLAVSGAFYAGPNRWSGGDAPEHGAYSLGRSAVDTSSAVNLLIICYSPTCLSFLRFYSSRSFS